MKSEFAFRVDVSRKIGIGHLIRLIDLKKKLKIQPIWLIKSNNYNVKKHLSNKDKIFFLQTKNKEINLIKKLKKNNIRKIVFDIAHNKNIKNKKILKIIKLYKNHNFKTISYMVDTKSLISDLNIIPYNYEINKSLFKKKLFLGPQYLGIKNSKKNKLGKIKKILICIGGTDAFNLGAKIYQQLINTNFQITYISGQNLNKFTTINKKHKIFSHKKNIKKIIENNDLIICGEGLIKYQSIYCNKPTFLIHQYDRRSILIKNFLKKNVCFSYKSKRIDLNFKKTLLNYILNKQLIKKHLNNQYLEFLKKNDKIKFMNFIKEIKKL